MSRLEGKNAVITGGNSGIGLATAQAFIDEGANVIIFGRNQETLDSAVESLGINATGIQGDVSNNADLDCLFALAKESFESIDILFVNAGIAPPTPFEQTSSAMIDQILSINVKGSFQTVQKALPLLKPGSSVIFTSSCLDEMGMPGFSIYSASKAAIRSLVRTLAAELSVKGIRVNSIAPGPIATPIHGRMGLSEDAMEEMGAQVLENIPLSRFGTPEEISAPVVFLASDDSTYMQGAELTVDGGMGQV